SDLVMSEKGRYFASALRDKHGGVFKA
ncbi:hypothetical protein PJIAN_3798, partial [Paludibacter jiangxiensis]